MLYYHLQAILKGRVFTQREKPLFRCLLDWLREMSMHLLHMCMLSKMFEAKCGGFISHRSSYRSTYFSHSRIPVIITFAGSTLNIGNFNHHSLLYLMHLLDGWLLGLEQRHSSK